MDHRRRLDELCINTIRTLSIDAVQQANSGHPGAPMGMAPVMYVLWDRFLRHSPSHPSFPNRDRFVLSMGHASMLLYSTLHLTGYELSLDDLRRFRQLHGKCAGHPESSLVPGVETTTGPLGQGIGNSVGMAIAQRWLAAHFNRDAQTIVDYTVYAMCSDGDLMEGVGSEAASLAGHLALSNLIWIYDNNGITIDGETKNTYSENVAGRFQAYGWLVQLVGDANNLDEIHVAIEAARAEANRPTLIIVKSQIGFGSPNRAGKCKAHGEALGVEEVRLAKEYYGWDPDKHFFVPDEVRVHMTDGAKRRGAALAADWQERFDLYSAANPELGRQWEQMHQGLLPEGWDQNLPEFQADEKGMATRVASGRALAAVAAKVPWMMGGSADLASSTKAGVPDSELFQRDCHAGRNLAFGVREHAMAAVINGLAQSKIRPFGSSFLTFTDYCRPAIRLAALSELPCIFVFTHDSIGLGEDGPTHQPIEHLASLRAMPNLDVIRPADANEASVAWKHIMRLADRPAVLALTRQRVPILDRTRCSSAVGLLKGAYVLLDCEGAPEVILIGTGSEVQHCVTAADRLAAEGVKARVVSMPCWELFERQPQSYRHAVLPPEVKARVSIEAGSTFGWSRYVGTEGSSIGIDRFGLSAPAENVMKEFGLTADNVIVEAKRQIERGSANRSHHAMATASPPTVPPQSDCKERTSGTLIQQIGALGQSIWCDSISRSMIDTGELRQFIEAGIVGVTSNPTIFHKAISTSDDYDEAIQSMVAGGKSAEEIYGALTVRDIADAADLLRGVYDRTGGRDGFVSLEVNPHLADDTDRTVAEARELFGRLNRPNIFIKVPATQAGIPVIETLIAEGMNVNVTLIFSPTMYAKVMEAYVKGLERLAVKGGQVRQVASVASFFVSRIDTLVDKKLQKRIDAGQTDLKKLLGKAAIGSAKLAYEQYKSVFHGRRFAALRNQGARVQRPLWASTSTKNPAYPDTYYVDTLIGPETVNTLPLNTVGAVNDHGVPAVTIENELEDYRTALADIEAAGIDMERVGGELLEAGVKAFADSFDLLMSDIRTKMTQLQTV